MIRFVVAVILVFISTNDVQAQKTAPPLSLDTLARIGTSIITERDLIERIELMPWEGKDKPQQHDSSKIKALSSLVAERLLASEAKHLSVGSDPVTELKINGMEKMFVRDELFNREVKRKVNISAAEINAGLSKFAWQLHVIAIDVKDKKSGDAVVSLLRKNIPLEKIFSTVRADAVTAVETVQVNFGGLDTLFENAVYAIGQRKFSNPFISKTYGWTVAVIMARGTNPVAEKMNSGDRRIRVYEIIRQRKESSAAGKYYRTILLQNTANTDSTLFYSLATALRTIIAVDSTRKRSNGLFPISSEDLDELLEIFHSDLQRPFIVFKEGSITLGEAIEGMRNLRFGIPSLDERPFNRAFNSHLRTVTETELMAMEGYRQNLQYDEKVQRDLRTWSDYWKSRYLIWKVNDSVKTSDEELRTALMRLTPAMGMMYEVKIQEVLCDSLTTAGTVLSEYTEGMSLSDLAKKYSRRTEWKNTGGMSEYLPINRMKDITTEAFLSETGEIVGPIKTEGGYSVFKVLEKRSVGPAGNPTPDSAIINLKQNMLFAKRKASLNSYVTALAKNYSIDVRFDKLPFVTIQPANMFTRRIIGFGGIITAVPMLYPNWEWMTNYRETSVIP